MRCGLIAALLALAVAPAGCFAAAAAQVPQGCSKGASTPGFFVGTLLTATPQKLVIWVRGAWKENARGTVTEPVDRTLYVSWTRTQRSS